MKFAAQRHYSASRFSGIGFVALLHVVLIYVLVNGLASKVYEVIRKPIETRIVEEVKPPQPTPAIILPPPPKFAPPPPFIPPPEVAVPVQSPQPVLAQRSATPQPQAAPMPAPAVAAAPAHTVRTEVGVVCPNSQQVRQSMQYPREAQRNNITGDVLVEFVVDAHGNMQDVQVVKSADPVLDRAAVNAVKQFNCVSQGEDVRVKVPFAFNLN
ncbi:energy transducer TonB [Paraburkholderia sp. RP-4-7]|jgi:protein TonB|uniref:Protein TonB n=1 Tax=Paraburkholderia polaris TaxID=2728848 RepID=A0A848I9D1_9BURK|nr:energy transducer TonB [Paraburkholderia polaris]NML99087.1 energy transducer TonB [Paraburkholderia polaris]